MDFSPSVEAAREELRTKSKQQIEAETSEKWCARAVAAYGFYTSTISLQWLSDAIAYHGEAVEHAAHASPQQLAYVESILDESQRVAFGLK
jgi:hypothetical protein